MNKQEIDDLSRNIGKALGTILPALYAFPPTDQEAAAVTAQAIEAVLKNSTGIPDEARNFIEGIVISLAHWASVRRPN